MREMETKSLLQSVGEFRSQKGKEALGSVVEIFGRHIFISETDPSGYGGYPLTDGKGNAINTFFVSPSFLILDDSAMIKFPLEQKELLEKYKKPVAFYLQKYHGGKDGKWAKDMLKDLLPKFYSPEGGLFLESGEIDGLVSLLIDLGKKKGLKNLENLSHGNFTASRIIANLDPLMVGERLIVDAGSQSDYEGSLYLNSAGGEVFGWDKDAKDWLRLKDEEDLWNYIEPYLTRKIEFLTPKAIL